MGREQGRGGKHLFLYIACVVGISQITVGCATITGKLQGAGAPAKADAQMERGDFRSALMENEKALRNPFPGSMSRILFQRGLILAHPRNPEGDLTGAVAAFQEVVDQYPSGDFGPASEVLVFLLQRMQMQEKENQNLSDAIVRMENVRRAQQLSIRHYRTELEILRSDIKTLTATVERLEHTLREHQGDYDHYQRILADRQENIDELNVRIEELKSLIESFKKIDLNIEKKKQDTKHQ